MMKSADDLKYVNKKLPKLDSMALVTGKPVYLDDVAPKDCLIVKVLRSPHASAVIESISTDFDIEYSLGIVCRSS